MKKDGTWDAHTYNEESGEVDYDETKDKRFRNENGSLKTENGEHVVRERIIKDLIEQGTQDLDNKEKLTKAYSHTLVDGTMKWYADKFIIGSMDELTKPILGNRVVGAAVSQFKVFSFNRMFNAGLFAKSRMVSKGVGYKAKKDDDGNWISVREQIEIEGQLQSFAKAFNAVKSFNTGEMVVFWKKASPITKLNLAKSLVQVATFALLYGLIRGAFDKDRFAWLYSDIFIGPTVSSYFEENPMVSVSLVSDFVKASMGGDAEKIAKTFGVTRNIIKGTENIESVSEALNN